MKEFWKTKVWQEAPRALLSLLLQWSAVCLLYFLIEWISRHSFWETLYYMKERPLIFLYNAGLIFTTTLVVYLFRRRFFVRCLLAFFWLGLGVINGVLLASRVTPFTGPDLHLITDAVKIVNRYLPGWGLLLSAVLGGGFLVALVFLFFKAPVYRGPLSLKLNLLLVLAGFAVFAGCTDLALERRVLSNYFGNIAFAYEDYGYPYCLVTTIFNTGISCPKDYSQGEMDRIAAGGEALPKTEDTYRPNILFLQLETFIDPTEVNFLEFSQDPVPNFRKLSKQYSSGYYRVPSVGAGTANTEFETITGMSLRYFGPGEYPYKSVLKEETCESAPYVLKSLGYTAHAIHNNEANFYGRRTVFPNLGFDTFISEEYMDREDEQTPLGWVKDRVLTKYILECMESTKGPDYIYTISVQGHGAYPEEEILEEPVIEVSGAASEEENLKWEYYVNQLYEMDQFVGKLVEALEENGEDTVLVMYGDHLPTMGLRPEDMKNRYLFQTRYVIWDNLGLPRKEENLVSYQMAAEILDRLDIHEGNVFKFHQARRKTKNYQLDLQTLQYDLLYGEKYTYGGKSPFAPTSMRLGLYDTQLSQVTRAMPLEDSYYVSGEYFTPSSEVQVNGEYVETTYISPSRLLISGVTLALTDRISVIQRSNSSTRNPLSKTHDRAYYAVKAKE